MSERVWYRHPPTCWALGDIAQSRGTSVLLRDVETSEETELTLVDKSGEPNTHPADPSHMDNLPDIALMNNLHQAPLLHLLRRRYLEDAIYTFTGDILISINPYMLVEGLYDIPDMDETEIGEYFIKKKIPHVFTVAERAYKAMREEANPSRKNQSMIVSGESGAGKTEACKRIMQFLAFLSEGYSARHERRSTAAARTSNIEKRVLDCNPFLEAFGNAMTVRNNNSSRFGKFLKIEYQRGYIVGASMRHYLLEKARVVSPQAGERNYHIFYQLCRGADAATAKRLSLRDPEDFHYLGAGGTTRVPGVDDKEEFEEVVAALTDVGIPSETQQSMWTAVAAIAHLGDIEFEALGDADAEASQAADPALVKTISDLFGAPGMPEKLVSREVRTRTDTVTVPLSAQQAAETRNALSKAAYDRLFTWLIMQANRCLESTEASSAFIGILDIFGFEIFEQNSFEQLCINYANEKLQNLFNHHIFIMEQSQYREEGIDVTSIEFINNQPCVDLIERKPFGILPMLDDICRQATRSMNDEKFKDRLDQAHKGKHRFYGSTRRRDEFVVAHFAGDVHYRVTGFIGKNNDALTQDLMEVMQASAVPFIAHIFDDDALESTGDTAGGDSPAAAAASSSGKSRSAATGPQTIASKFKKQLAELNDTLLATTPHYVRCIKPNGNKAAHDFDFQRVLDQLLYSGVLETVRIRRQGFPFRETYGEFWRRCCTGGGGEIPGFRALVPETWDLQAPPPAQYEEVVDEATQSRYTVDRSLTPEVIAYCKDGTEKLCQALLGEEQFRMGATKVFMKDGCLDSISKRFMALHTVSIQRWWRMASARAVYNEMRLALVLAQRQWKNCLAERRAKAIEKLIVKLQAHARRRIARRLFLRRLRARHTAVDVLQRNGRMWIHRRRYLRQRRDVIVVQTRVRRHLAVRRAARRRWLMVHTNAICMGHLARLRANRVRKARKQGCTQIQAVFKGYLARQRYSAARACVYRVQAVFRGHRERTHYRLQRLSAVILQSWWRGRSKRMWFLRVRSAITRMSASVRMLLARHRFLLMRKSARRISRAWFAVITSRALLEWVNELQSAASWGDVAEVKSVFECASPRWNRVRDIPPAQRVNIRTRFDGKAALHTAAAGQVDAVRLLVSLGADVFARDRAGATPLHKAAQVGDGQLQVLEELLLAADAAHSSTSNGAPTGGNGEGAKLLASMSDFADETPLEVSVREQRRARRKTHLRTIKRLLDLGGSDASGADVARAMLIAMGVSLTTTIAGGGSSSTGGSAAGGATASSSSSGAGGITRTQSWVQRDERMWQQQQEARRRDPHYQLLMVQEEERRKQGERRRAKQRQEEAAIRDRQSREDTERRGLAAEDAQSRATEDSARTVEARRTAERRARIAVQQRTAGRARAGQEAHTAVTAESARRKRADARRGGGGGGGGRSPDRARGEAGSTTAQPPLTAATTVQDTTGRTTISHHPSSSSSSSLSLSASSSPAQGNDHHSPMVSTTTPPSASGASPGWHGNRPARPISTTTAAATSGRSPSPDTRGLGSARGSPRTASWSQGSSTSTSKPVTLGSPQSRQTGQQSSSSSSSPYSPSHGSGSPLGAGSHSKSHGDMTRRNRTGSAGLGSPLGGRADTTDTRDVDQFARRVVRSRSARDVAAATPPSGTPSGQESDSRVSQLGRVASTPGSASTPRTPSHTAPSGTDAGAGAGDADQHASFSVGVAGSRGSHVQSAVPARSASLSLPGAPKGLAAGSTSAAQAAVAAEPVPSAEPQWTVHQSRSTGMLYYFSTETGQTQWQEPEDFDGEYEQWMVPVAMRTARAAGREPTAALKRDLRGLSAKSVTTPSRVKPSSSSSSSSAADGSSSASGQAPTAAAIASPAAGATQQRDREHRGTITHANDSAWGSPHQSAQVPTSSSSSSAREFGVGDSGMSPVPAPVLGGRSGSTGSSTTPHNTTTTTTAGGGGGGHRSTSSRSNNTHTGGSSLGGGIAKRKVVADVPLLDLSHLGPDHAWRQHVTGDGLVYYSNSATGSTTWDRPSCLGPLVLEEEADVVVMVGDSRVSMREADPDVSGSASGAEEASVAAEAKTEDPTRGIESRAHNGRSAGGSDGAETGSEMPELFHSTFKGKNGWISATDAEGYVYYVHEPTRRTQWERPEGFL